MEKPSGPGALSGSMAHITSTIYFSQKDFTKPALSSSEIKEVIKDNKINTHNKVWDAFFSEQQLKM